MRHVFLAVVMTLAIKLEYPLFNEDSFLVAVEISVRC